MAKKKIIPSPDTDTLLFMLNDGPLNLAACRFPKGVSQILTRKEINRLKTKRYYKKVQSEFERFNVPLREIIDLVLEGRGDEAAFSVDIHYGPIPSRVSVSGNKHSLKFNIQPDYFSKAIEDRRQDATRIFCLFHVCQGPDLKRIRKCAMCGKYFFDSTTNLSKLRCSRRCTNRAVARDYRWKARQI